MKANRCLLCICLATGVTACSSHEERTPSAQYSYELLCQDLQMEYLYAETEDERDAAKDQIDRLECNRSVSSDERRRRDADHWRSMRGRGTADPAGDIRIRSRDP